MNPGMMRNKIIFYTPSKSADGYGGFTSGSNSTSATFFAHAVEKSGKIETKDGKQNYYREIEITFRRDAFGVGSAIGKKFTVDGAGFYKVNNYYNILNNDEYTTIVGTLEP